MSEQIVRLHTENGTLAIPGVEFRHNELVIDRNLGIGGFQDLIRFLVAVEGCSLFWWGDLLNWLKANADEQHAVEAASQSSNPERLLEAMVVCDGLKSRKRISYAHHREAYAETGRNSVEAIEWLAKAENAGWTVAEMRRQIRYSRIQGSVSNTKGSITLTTLFSSLKSRISSLTNDRPIDEWTLDEICAVKADLEPIERFASQVRERFDKFNPELIDV